MLLSRFAETIPRFQEVRPAIELYLDRVVPQVLYLTVGFFVAGALLIFLGSRIAPREPPAVLTRQRRRWSQSRTTSRGM